MDDAIFGIILDLEKVKLNGEIILRIVGIWLSVSYFDYNWCLIC